MKQIDKWKESNSNFDFNEDFVYQQIKRNKTKVIFKRILQVCTCCLALIFVLSNTSTTYIQATKSIPLLGQLNELLNFNSSIYKAIENDYIQKLDIKEEKDGLKVHVEQVVADEKEIYVFYHITYNGKDLDVHEYDVEYPKSYLGGPRVMDQLIRDGYHISYDEVLDTSKLIDNYNLEFTYNNINLKVNIPIDENRIAKHKTYETNEVIDIEGQKLIIEKIEVYPLATRIYVKEDENNTDTIQRLNFNLIANDELISQRQLIMLNGVYYLESPYFLEDNYEITLESVMLTPKNATATLNLKTGEYNDPTGLTSIVEYDRNYYHEFDHDGEITILNTKITIESKTEQALSEGYFMHYPDLVDYSEVITYEISYSENKTSVYNIFTCHLEEDADETVDFKINTGKTVDINYKVKLK